MSDFPSLEGPAIISLKGPPAVGKWLVATFVARWAKTPVLCVEDFLTREAAPRSKEEAERHAFGLMCNVVGRQVTDGIPANPCVMVLKSRLCSTFESDQLIELLNRFHHIHALIIIELRCTNMLLRRRLFDQHFRFNRARLVSWYNLDNFDEVEKASNEYDAHAWDSHFDNSIAELPNFMRRRVRRLVVDISSSTSSIGGDLDYQNTPFLKVIRYLLTEEAMHQLPNTVDFDEMQQDVLVRELNTPRARDKYLCGGERGCIFKYRQACESDSCCGVCDRPASGSVYTCYYCILVLHKSCAEEPKMVDLSNHTPYQDRYDRGRMLGRELYHFDVVYACDRCKDSDKSFSYSCKSCLFQTHLKCRVMPTIVNHACHPQHFLSIWFRPAVGDGYCPPCEGCYTKCFYNGYVCVICNYNYHIRCLATLREVKHEHGKYEHVMKLMYSYDGMEEHEDFWCDVCCDDIDPALWFYRCKECTYYVSHMDVYDCMPCNSS